jgi:hypothetical protein
MGLDVSYYSKLKKCQRKEDDENDDEYDDYAVNTKYNGDFQYQLGSLKGVYNLTESSVSGHISCGAYSSYNSWRNELAIMSGYGSAQNVWSDTDFNPCLPYINLRYRKLKKINKENAIGEQISIKPFYELINFSDCEGVIGPEISKKLYKDFVDFEQMAKNCDDYFYRKYNEWKEAFRIASEGGAICFH